MKRFPNLKHLHLFGRAGGCGTIGASEKHCSIRPFPHGVSDENSS
uniref:Uncharacterized protein n=1 Tax=Nelumbo nucifera TaxID=4432 RepID=A0A822Y2R3_NELNU|nr:TPA_asm: hypothetical protein HUJ06_026809 [Nelumbo nucifera]